MSRTDVFEQQRSHLYGIAYRMLCSRAEAEDIVQEAWLRWDRAASDEIRVPKASLITTTTRLCIDRLRQLHADRELYVGPWLPEPLTLEPSPPADRATELASDLSVAFLAVLERLAPEERGLPSARSVRFRVRRNRANSRQGRGRVPADRQSRAPASP